MGDLLADASELLVGNERAENVRWSMIFGVIGQSWKCTPFPRSSVCTNALLRDSTIRISQKKTTFSTNVDLGSCTEQPCVEFEVHMSFQSRDGFLSIPSAYRSASAEMPAVSFALGYQV